MTANNNPKWVEEGNIVYFDVTSDGTSGFEWVKRLQKQGVVIGEHFAEVLVSSEFVPTSGVTTRVGVWKDELFDPRDRILAKIRLSGFGLGFSELGFEVGCLIREKFSNAEINSMGFEMIIAMSKSISSHKGPTIPSVLARGKTKHILGFRANDHNPITTPRYGYAFAAPR